MNNKIIRVYIAFLKFGLRIENGTISYPDYMFIKRQIYCWGSFSKAEKFILKYRTK